MQQEARGRGRAVTLIHGTARLQSWLDCLKVGNPTLDKRCREPQQGNKVLLHFLVPLDYDQLFTNILLCSWRHIVTRTHLLHKQILRVMAWLLQQASAVTVSVSKQGSLWTSNLRQARC